MLSIIDSLKNKVKTDHKKLLDKFGKIEKTTDPQFDKKMNYVKETVVKVDSQFKNVKDFIESADNIME